MAEMLPYQTLRIENVVGNVLVNQISLDLFLKEETGNQSLSGLSVAWATELVSKADQRYIESMIKPTAYAMNVPILLCPDDLDFSCTIVAANIQMDGKYVYWNKIGFVNKKDMDFRAERESGILNLPSWTEKDWEELGAFAFDLSIDNPDIAKWMSENWLEEETRRIRNYVHPYFQDDEHIDWFEIAPIRFHKTEYLKVINETSFRLE